MKRHVDRTLSAALLCMAALTHTPARSADLTEVYAMAAENDPEFRRVAANKRAILELRPQAIADLLPAVNLTGNTYNNDQDISAGFVVGGSGSSELDFNSHGYALNLSQPLFRTDRWLRLRQANSQIRQADAELTAAQQDLMLRTSLAYFLVLGAGDNLQFAEAEKKSLSRQLEQAKQRFEVGLTAITDVQEAQAGYDRAVAQEIAAQNDLSVQHEVLRQITGQYLTDLAVLGDDMPLVNPEPEDIEQWTTTALDQNAQVQAQLYAVETAREEIKVQFTGHLPTLDLVARHGYDKSGGRFSDSKVHATAVGLELNVPIFQGGYVNSRTREARQRLDASLESLELARRQTQRQTRASYLSVISGISQVKAFKQALVSSETALEATNAGFEVGTRTAVDVVAAERLTSQARRDFARSKYDYILNTIRLKQAAGTLSDQDLSLINQWLR
ncbi:MAG TPA: TolC family outer membrane protein [Gammaproteobacteria bacterium]|jgi:outer membrane protein